MITNLLLKTTADGRLNLEVDPKPLRPNSDSKQPTTSANETVQYIVPIQGGGRLQNVYIQPAGFHIPISGSLKFCLYIENIFFWEISFFNEFLFFGRW